MTVDISAYAHWIKALHVVCVLLWVGPQLIMGLLILALRQLQAEQTPLSKTLIVRINWLINGGINFAMMGAFVLGALLASLYWTNAAALPTWLWLKVALVLVLATIHGLLFRQYKQVRRGLATWPAQVFDGLQLSSFVVAIIIVLLVMAKPLINL